MLFYPAGIESRRRVKELKTDDKVFHRERYGVVTVTSDRVIINFTNGDYISVDRINYHSILEEIKLISNNDYLKRISNE